MILKDPSNVIGNNIDLLAESLVPMDLNDFEEDMMSDEELIDAEFFDLDFFTRMNNLPPPLVLDAEIQCNRMDEAVDSDADEAGDDAEEDSDDEDDEDAEFSDGPPPQ